MYQTKAKNTNKIEQASLNSHSINALVLLHITKKG